MSQAARVESIEKLKDLRVALVVFMDSARTGLLEAEAEIQRADMWLKNDQLRYWKSQIMSRREMVTRAKIALSQKKLTHTPLGGHYSCVDEEKALQLARRRLEEAETKVANVQKWGRRLDEEVFEYKGQVQSLSRTIESDLPAAVNQLDRMTEALESYATLQAAGLADLDTAAAAPSVARGGELDLFAVESGPSPGRVAEYQALRLLTPSREARSHATVSQAPEALADHPLRQLDLDGIAKVPLTREPAQPDSRLTLGADSISATRVYLHRSEAIDSQDTGWYLGAIGSDTPDSLTAIRTADLLARRPQWADILALPAGTLVVIDGNRIEAALDAQDTILWPAQPKPAEKKGET
jgi:hypothetical protein